MRYSVLLIVAVSSLGLNSCHSFNRYEFHDSNGRDPALESKHDLILEASIEDEALAEQIAADGGRPGTQRYAEAVCPVYRLPQLPPTPKPPYDQLTQAGNSPDHPYDKMAQAEIKDLYTYISVLKESVRASHEDYLIRCADYLRTAHQNSAPK